MIERVQSDELCPLEPFFAGKTDTMIRSCLEGEMGCAYRTGTAEKPVSVQLLVGDFCFFGGAPDEQLAAHIPTDYMPAWMLVADPATAWASLLEQTWQGKSKWLTRYAFAQDTSRFRSERLREFAEMLPEEYTIRRMGDELYKKSLESDWSRDLVSQFSSAEDYQKRGIGFAALYQGQLAAGASSYTVYSQGIEIEIDTHPAHRRKGLARACVASLMLACLESGRYPSWDAANPVSRHLAESLGYQFEREYATLCIRSSAELEEATL